MKKAALAVVIPAYNEEKVLQASIRSLAGQIKKQHIYLVSDGSSDQTAKLAKSVLGKNVLALRKNVGKARALDRLFKRFSLTSRYQYVFFFDADTKIGKNFISEIRQEIKNKPALIIGSVKSDRRRMISAYRVYEYGFSFNFYKRAQESVGAIIIAPGCASIYRSDVLDQLDFHGGTLTEDFDLTLQIHRKKLGKIAYRPRAQVITQDPLNFQDFWKQITRWNTGFWQNFIRHKLFKPTSVASLETQLLLGDFVFWAVIGILSLTSVPTMIFTLLSSMAIITIVSAGVIIAERQFWALLYVPTFWFLQLITNLSLIYCLFRTIFSKSEKLSWQKLNRYSMPA